MSSQPPSWGDPTRYKLEIFMRGYTNYRTNYYNWGIHNNTVILGNLTIWFHYRIPIAFQKKNHDLVICKNERGDSGIGRALNTINRDKSLRIQYDDFTYQLRQILREPCF